MKVLQINSVCGVGSTGRIATDLYKVLEEQGHECVIAYGRGTAPEGIKTIKIGTDFDNYMHVAKTRLFDKHGFGSTKATKEFIKKVKEYNPDVIHLHNIHGYYINIEILFNYLKEANKKVIWTLHDCWAFTGHCSHFDYVECNKWMYKCNRCKQKKEYPSSLLFDMSAYNYEMKKRFFTNVKNLTIITPSKWLESKVKESFLSGYKTKVISNGIDLNVFKFTKNNFKENNNIEDKKIVLSVSSIWNEKKGIRDLLELSEQLTDDYKMVVVGLDKNQISKLPNNIIKMHKTNNLKELVEVYSAADVFVNLSVEETMGLVTIEAIACGTPSIVYNSTATPETIDDNVGIVVDKNDIRSIKDAIERITEDKVYNLNKCYNFAKNFDKNIKYKEYINLYIE
ncbi:glycosyltransferase [Clostridium perfringens]|nr:glycosyltransferase [Clostridium perfringens]MDU2516337.1 glycosyltransferase [Clostridium perfringens]